LTDPKAKLAGIVERLAYQTENSVAIEIKPASSLREKSVPEPNVEITLDRLKSKPDEKEEEIDKKPKLKLTIKTPNKHPTDTGSREKKTDSGGKLFDDLVSPKLDKTFQIPKICKLDSPTFKKDKSSFPTKSPSTSPKHSSSKSSHSKSSHSKINERFITDPSAVNKRLEERKRSSDRDRDSPHFKTRHESEGYKSGGTHASVSMHIVKSPAPSIHVQSPLSGGLGQLSPLSDSLLDEGLLLK